MKKQRLLYPIVLALVILSAAPVQAQIYAVDWWTTAWGGEILSGGGYTLSGTGGQPDAGTISGGNFTLTGGFLAVETPSFLYLPLIIRDSPSL
jgi:hypothetical protein